jgi:hypothetical protein
MRVTLLVSFVLGMSGITLAQAQVTAPDLEARYVKACLKEDKEAYCRCEFQALAQRVKDPKDLEFLTQLEEQTAGLPDDALDEAMKKLPPDRLQWVITLSQEMAPTVEKCPDYRPRN